MADTYDKYFRIVVNGIQFQLLHNIQGSKHIYAVLDSKDVECIRITVDIDDPETELFIGSLSYCPDCALDKSLPRGEGTVAMIKAALIFVMKQTEMDFVTLTDDSSFDCELPDDDALINIELYTHNFLIYGKTWYQRKFGAVPDDKLEIERERERDMEISLDNLHKPLPNDFKYIWPNHLSTNLKHNNWLVAFRDEMKELYETKKSEWDSLTYFHEIFGKEFKENVHCAIFKLLEPHLRKYYNIPNFKMTQWKIERSAIESYPEFTEIVENVEPLHVKRNNDEARFTYIPNFTVGGKRTRKNGTRHTVKYIPKFYAGLYGYLSTAPSERINNLGKTLRKRTSNLL